MAGIVSEESVLGKSVEGISSGQHYHSGEALAEWRSSEQVENGITSTSPPYWDTDDEEDCGLKPSELYGKHTWKIEKFSQISKRELRSNAFEIGGYKWYILIYPQGCDVCNHLSLFLCVANHDKFLPGWSHFAQFTIAIANKDPKKSKHSDTLHRFWKKEHDWGWKKFMELSKVYDGFVDTSDNLIIKAQVQVISFFAFWGGIDQNSRRHMSREKTDVILKVIVKHFFIEKEVTSTLVMDSLYSGLKALEGQTKGKKGRVNLLGAEEMPAPIVHVENNMFVLVDDVSLLLERAATEPLPPKDEKGPQNRTKDGNSGEDFDNDSMQHDEMRLTELGRRTLEIFVLVHVFSNKIEVAYREAVALKRQEELIREEEAASQAESEKRAKRRVNDREKKSKKKQAKQKRNNRKGKDKGREESTAVAVHDKNPEDNAVGEKKDSYMADAQTLSEKPDAMEDVSDVSDSAYGVSEVLQPDSEDRDASPVNWDTDASEVHPPTKASNNGIGGVSSIQNGRFENRSSSVVDDSSSTCSTDSLPSVFMSDPYKGNSFSNYTIQKSPSRGKNRGKASRDVDSWTNEIGSQPSGSAAEARDNNDESGSGKVGESASEGSVLSLQDRLKWAEKHVVRKKEEALSLQKEHSIKDHIEIEGTVDTESLQKEKISRLPSSPISTPRNLSSSVQMKLEQKTSATVDPVHVKKTYSNGSLLADKDASILSNAASQVTNLSKFEIQKSSTARLTERSVPLSRTASAPLVPGLRSTAPVVSMVQMAPLPARSVSAASRLGPNLSPATNVPQSYRNAMMGNPVASTAASLTYSSSSSSGVNSSPGYSQPSSMLSSPMFLPQSSDRVESNPDQSGLPFGMIACDNVQSGPQWMEISQREASRRMHFDQPSRTNDFQNHDLYRPLHSRSLGNLSTEFPPCTSGRQNQGLLVDEFPYLDIINDLLDDEHGIGKTPMASSVFQPWDNRPQFLNRHFTSPGDLGADDDLGSLASSCRFEQSRGYHHGHGFQGGYSSSGGHFGSPRDYIPHTSAVPYANGQSDRLVPNQWQVAGSDLSYLGMRNSENGGYSYYQDYSNMACGVNGYNVFRPSNGP
ncbi:PREDICTED: MATH domain-containing protein At5g43560-like isoform X2 [Lupinus angustifolius]|uniref:MATH domain-containing protein At5g43560-like isoform X2 n=1 Tax=Lupinus angustifolius TaxID=3871 RepID=UPI00092FA94F|nr:PREDICTED: MATH domain-containing protein At5g43560-like isoform X2 [Lupinus angustifolius]